MDIHEINGIPVLAREEVLHSEQPLVIVIHGMSTTAEVLRQGWPDDQNDGISRIYWRLPVLREGRDAVVARRNSDIFRDLFWPVVRESRLELTRLIHALDRPSVGLFGFSIGGLISLWGGIDNPSVKASVAVGGVPYLDYLLQFYPDYDWTATDVIENRTAIDLRNQLYRVSAKSTLILHGLEDDQAQWSWMQPFSETLSKTSPYHKQQTYDHVRHRLTGSEGEAEEADLVALRSLATQWLLAQL